MNLLNESSGALTVQVDRPVPPGNAWRRDRWFFTSLAVAAGLLIFIGFAPTYFLKAWYGSPPLLAILHVHRLLMTSWVVLVIIQVSLVAVGRTDLHRRLGVAGAVLAAMIVVITVVTVIEGLRVPFGLAAIVPAQVLVSLGSMAQFAGFVGAALVYTRKPETHKRLIFIAMAVLLTASVGRLIGGPSPIQALAVCAVSDSLVIAMIVYDLVTRRRVHASLAWGGSVLAATQFIEAAAPYTGVGRAIVAWLQN